MGRKSIPRTGTARNVQPKEHDPYRRRRKTKDATVCDECGVVCHNGRWYWGAPPLGNETGGLCPACRRIRDRYPAGTIRLSGLTQQLQDELLSMIHSTEDRERQAHPLERLIDIEDHEGSLTITTTGTHLARCIASALRRRFHDAVAIRYADDESFVQVDLTG